MFKMITLLKRRSGMSMADFVEYYEANHAAIAAQLMQPYAKLYRRNYLASMPNPLTGELIEPEYDAVTEVWFADRAAFNAAMAMFASPEVSAEMIADEERLFDRTRSRLMIVDGMQENRFGD